MRLKIIFGLALSLSFQSAEAKTIAPKALTIPQVVISDPAVLDAKFPARFEHVHIPTGGVEIYGYVLVAQGKGPHPVLVMFHGHPANEKNADLAQAVRRAGWNVLMFSYRGAWGSQGRYSFTNNLEDASAVLAFIRDPANASRLGLDTRHIVLAGHSMGGWVAAKTAAADSGVEGVITISAADMGLVGQMGRKDPAAFVTDMNDFEGLVADGKTMAEELAEHGDVWSFEAAAPKLKNLPLLVLTANDGLAEHSNALVRNIRAAGGTLVTAVYTPTDHTWSDRRITLAALIVNWLKALPSKP